MLSYIGLCVMLLTVNYISTVDAIPAPSTSISAQNQKFSNGVLLEQYGDGSAHSLFNHQYDDDHIDDDEFVPEKKHLKKKWAKYHQGIQSPYTIAFPALIRSRRWIEEAQ